MKYLCLLVWFWVWCALQFAWMLWLLMLHDLIKNIIVLQWFWKCYDYKRFHNACFDTWVHDVKILYMESLVLMACIGERSLCGLEGKCPVAWSWSRHLWPTVVEWHRWDYCIYIWIILCLGMRVGGGDTLKALVNWEPHDSPHEGTQANTKVGFWF